MTPDLAVKTILGRAAALLLLIGGPLLAGATLSAQASEDLIVKYDQ